jgi:hypothetical protein
MYLCVDPRPTDRGRPAPPGGPPSCALTRYGIRPYDAISSCPGSRRLARCRLGAWSVCPECADMRGWGELPDRGWVTRKGVHRQVPPQRREPFLTGNLRHKPTLAESLTLSARSKGLFTQHCRLQPATRRFQKVSRSACGHTGAATTPAPCADLFSAPRPSTINALDVLRHSLSFAASSNGLAHHREGW